MLFGNLCRMLVLFSSFHLFLLGPAPWVILVFNHSLPRQWTRTGLHSNGSVLREHYSLCKSEMVRSAPRVLSMSLVVTSQDRVISGNTYRRHLDVAGQKSSKLYICNGIALFFGWLVLFNRPQNLSSFLCPKKKEKKKQKQHSFLEFLT